MITTIAEARAIVDFAKALGFTETKLLFWNQRQEETLHGFDLGISLGAETWVGRDGDAIKGIFATKPPSDSVMVSKVWVEAHKHVVRLVKAHTDTEGRAFRAAVDRASRANKNGGEG